MIINNKGYLMVILAAILWGVQGNVAQVLMQSYHLTPDWLVSIRMLSSGKLILLFLLIFQKKKREVFSVWRQPSDRIQIIIFSIIGVLGVQITFFKSIDLGNAAMAALLQFLAPSMILIYTSIKLRSLPNQRELLSVGVAVLGLTLLITNGTFAGLSVPMGAVIWGVTSAGTLAFYTVYPKNLLDRFGSIAVVGWSMFIGGIIISMYAMPWVIPGTINLYSIMLILFSVVFGTIIPFVLYLASLKYIAPSITSILTCVEPLTATLVGVLLLQVTMGGFQVVGGVLIILTIFILPREQGAESLTNKTSQVT